MIKKFRRTQYIVQRSMQLRFARFVVIFVFASAIATGLIIFLTTFMLMGEKLASVYPQGRLVSIFQSVYLWAFVSLAAVMPFIFWGAIIFSHRIAGPIPKIMQALRSIGKGDFDVHLILRKRDELKELVEVINEMARNLKEREAKK